MKINKYYVQLGNDYKYILPKCYSLYWYC